MKKVSLYIPTHNSGKYLESCLKSVFSQSIKFSEVFIVDEASNDDTIKIAQNFNVRIIRIKEGSGLASARNAGLAHARYDYVASVDSDVVLGKDWLRNIMANFNDKKVAGIGGKLLEDMPGKIVCWRRDHMPQNWGEKKIINPKFLFGSNCVFDKKKIKEAGGYGTEYKTNYEDVDFSNRLTKTGLILVYDPFALCYHRKQDTLFSLIKSFYRWNLFAYPAPNNLRNLFYRIFAASPYTLFNLLRDDLFRLRLHNIPLDFLVFFSYYIMDISYFLKK